MLFKRDVFEPPNVFPRVFANTRFLFLDEGLSAGAIKKMREVVAFRGGSVGIDAGSAYEKTIGIVAFGSKPNLPSDIRFDCVVTDLFLLGESVSCVKPCGALLPIIGTVTNAAHYAG